MSTIDEYIAAVRVAADLGWLEAAPAEALTLSAGTPKQRATVRAGFATGSPHAMYRDACRVSGDVAELSRAPVRASGLLAIASGVDARRAHELLEWGRGWDDLDAVTALLARRDEDFRRRFVVSALPRPRPGKPPEPSDTEGVALRLLVDGGFDLPNDRGAVEA